MTLDQMEITKELLAYLPNLEFSGLIGRVMIHMQVSA